MCNVYLLVGSYPMRARNNMNGAPPIMSTYTLELRSYASSYTGVKVKRIEITAESLREASEEAKKRYPELQEYFLYDRRYAEWRESNKSYGKIVFHKRSTNHNHLVRAH